MGWDRLDKRYGVACFENPQPRDWAADGDAAAFFDRRAEAEQWIKKASNAGRFKYFVLWDLVSGQWIYEDEFFGLIESD